MKASRHPVIEFTTDSGEKVTITHPAYLHGAFLYKEKTVIVTYHGPDLWSVSKSMNINELEEFKKSKIKQDYFLNFAKEKLGISSKGGQA